MKCINLFSSKSERFVSKSGLGELCIEEGERRERYRGWRRKERGREGEGERGRGRVRGWRRKASRER